MTRRPCVTLAVNMLRRIRKAAEAALILAWLSVSPNAFAEPTAPDVAVAQALFDEGKSLMSSERYAEACPKFEESQRLDPSGGTILALALCHEAEGKTATAWADFNAALTHARRDRRAERESAALEHIKALESKLTRVRIVVREEAPGLEILRNGRPIGKAQWGTPVPIDPGEVHVEARAPQKKSWSTVAHVEGDGQTVAVTVPALEDATVEAPASTAPAPSRGKDEASRSRDLTWVFVSAGVGLAAAGVGTAFGLSAQSTWDDAKQGCPSLRCSSEGPIRTAEDAKSSADAATISFVVAGAAFAAAAVFFYTSSPSAPDAKASASKRGLHFAPSAGASSGGVLLGGSL